MAKTKKMKKTQTELKAERAENANKARQTLIDKEIAKYEDKAEKKAERAENANKARQSLINKEIAKYEADKKIQAQRKRNIKKARQAMIDKEIPKRYPEERQKLTKATREAEAASKIAVVATKQAKEAKMVAMVEKNARIKEEQAHKKEISEKKKEIAESKQENKKLKTELNILRSQAGAREQAGTTLWLAIASLVCAIIYVVLYEAVENEWAHMNLDATKITYIIFAVLMFACLIGALVLVSPLWGTLRKEGHLKSAASISLIFIWIFSAFALAIFIVDILDHASSWLDKSIDLITLKGENTSEILNCIAIASPVIISIFSGILYGTVKEQYPKVQPANKK